MKKILTITFALILLAACVPTPTAMPLPVPTATVFPTATATAIPTQTSTPTATPRPQPRVIADNTALYAGPGNIGYETLAQLAQGTEASPIGIYGDFVKVAISNMAKEGFVASKYLENLPPNLSNLPQDQLPWRESINVWDTLAESGRFRYDNTNPEESGTYNTIVNEAEPVYITGPFAVQLQFTGQGKEYGIVLQGRFYKGTEWWSGIRRLDIRIYNGTLGLYFLDGTKANGQSYNLPQLLKSQRITLQFDKEGNTILVLGQDGNPVTQNPIRLSASLVPDGNLYFGLNTAPKSSLEVSVLSFRVPPSGKFTVATATTTPTSSPFPPLPRLYVDGPYLKRTDTKEVVWLKGANVVSPITPDTPRRLSQTRAYIKIAKDWGVNLIRIQFDVGRAKANEDTLREIIRLASDSGMYVILAPTSIDNPLDYPKLPNDEVASIMRYFAQVFADMPNMLFGIYNEPHDITWEQWLPWATKISTAIREGNPNAILVVSGTEWSRDFRYLRDHPFPFSNVVYDVHDYKSQSPEYKRDWWNWMIGKYPIVIGEFGGGTGSNPTWCPYQSPCDLDYMRGTLAVVNEQPMLVHYTMHQLYCCNLYSMLGPSINEASPKGQLVVDDLKKYPPTRFR